MNGVYCLCIKVSVDAALRVGALGAVQFPAGFYIYVGSALNGLKARLDRHLRSSRGENGVRHWHIDYLLSSPGAGVVAIYAKETGSREECGLAGYVAGFGEPVRGFGCSDCRCVSHLFRVAEFDFLEDYGLSIWDSDSLI